MIRIVPYETRDKEVWNRFNKEAKNGLFMFDRNYMDYHSDRFVDHSLLFYDGHKLLALLPCNVCGDTLYSHQGLTFGGFITQDSMRQSKMLDCFALLRDYMRTLGMRRLIYKSIPYIYHKSPANEDSYALFRNGAKLFRVDCSTTCYKNMRLNELKKRNVKKAEREDVSIEESTDMKGFVELLNAVLQERHGVMAVHTEAELRLLHSRFKENIILYLAKHKEVIVAGSLLFVYENCVHTQYLATNECGRKIGALDLLLKTLIDKYTQSKTYFDFGISTENEGRFLNEGLIFQKESFGGHTIVHNF